MALTVGELAVEFDAETTKLKGAIKDLNKRVGTFSKKAQTDATKAGSSFKSLGKTIGVVAGAIGAFKGAQALVRFTSASVEASASMEGFEVRLKALLGSQGAANKALENFVTLSAETPFAVQQIVGGAATLASVANKSREELEELTLVTANLAAVTGLNFQDAAGNLQRSLATGIASADLFRERGVKKLIESITGIPDLTKEPLERQRELFKEVFGSGPLAEFGGAAEALSLTLGGALSNIGDASTRMKVAFGDALSPTIVATAKQFIIPALDELESIVKDNEDAIVSFTTEGIAGLLEGLASALGVVADVIETLDSLGITTERIGGLLELVGSGFSVLFATIRAEFNKLKTALSAIAFSFAKLGNLVGVVTDAELDEAFKRFNESATDLDAAIANQIDTLGDFKDAAVDAFSIQNAPGSEGADRFREFEDAARGAAGGVRELSGELVEARKERRAAEEEAGGEAGGGGVVAATATQIKAADQLLALQVKLRQEEDARLDPLLGQINAIDQQIQKLDLLNVAAADEGLKQETIAGLLEKRLRLTQEIAEAQREGDTGLDSDDLQAFGRDLGMAAETGLKDAFGRAVTGEGGVTASLSAALGEVETRSFQDGLENAFEGATDVLGSLLQNVGQAAGSAFSSLFSALGGAGGISPELGQALAGAGQLAVGAGLQALRGNQAKSTTRAVASAVTETREVRGVVAGPRNISVAETGSAIADAFIETERLDRIQIDVLERIEAALLSRPQNATAPPAPVDSPADVLNLQSTALG